MARKTMVLLLIGAAMFALYLVNIPREEAILRLRQFPRGPLMIIIASNALTPVLKALRWRFLLGRAADDIPFRTLVSSVSAGFFLGLVTPGTSGELGRVVTLHIDKTLGLGSILFEKIWDLIILMLIALTALVVIALDGVATRVAAAAVWLAGAVVIYMIAKRPKLASSIPRLIVRRFLSQERGDQVAAIWKTYVGLLQNPRLTLLTAFLAFVLWVIPGYQFFLILKHLGVDATLRMVLVSFFIPYLAGVLSLVPLGLGVFDLSTAQLSRGAFGLGHAEATASVLLFRLLISLVLVLWGFYCYVHRIRKKERTARRLKAGA